MPHRSTLRDHRRPIGLLRRPLVSFLGDVVLLDEIEDLGERIEVLLSFNHLYVSKIDTKDID